MPFITQGKTNWKYIIIVLILAVIVGVITWQYLLKSQPWSYLIEPTENETEKFLGDESKWDNIKIELKDIQGLFEERNISISGKGETTVEITRLGFEELDTKTHNLLLSKSEVKEIINTFIKNDFVTITTKDRPGIPDEARPKIILTNAKGKQHKTAVWDNDLQKNERFMNIYQELLLIEKKAEIIGWNTYRNEEYGFEIKYPKEWYQDKKESDLRKSYSDKKGFDIIRFSPNEEFLDWSDKEGLIKIDIISDFNEDLQIWFNKISTPCTECAPFPPSFDSYTTIDGKPAIKAIQGVPGTAGWISVFCTKDNIRYDFTLALPDTNDKSLINDHKNIFNQMLSTFRFLE